MAKRKLFNQLPADTSELLADGANPRKINDDGAAGLAASLARFGDLSGIVFNRRSGELVTGHQRMQQIREKFGDHPIETLDADAELGVIRIDAEHHFTVRVVDWTKAKQRAANVAANNQLIQGKFTADVTEFLLTVQGELEEELPGVMDDVLLTELVAARLDTTEASGDPPATEDGTPADEETAEETPEGENQPVPDVYQVVIDLETEDEQKTLYDRLTAEGLSVKLLTV
jgi:hypothetical protein